MNDKNRFPKMLVLFFFFINQTKKLPVDDFVLLFSSSIRRKKVWLDFQIKIYIYIGIQSKYNMLHMNMIREGSW